ncbi:hypothetical protein LPTSP3_g26550 [Leptospira kobayashii]|uniref:Uncharacterized protein n=1 Tax=Leptospira kobayashii TaxID=1917830 RepID=A0ABN6KLL0_9LEPT|nr:hypothetical protein [Leptospira kobayashii]BDA79725.1 hypothetical protein LPTSP3_g26550 [Leptospira kobayashii]
MDHQILPESVNNRYYLEKSIFIEEIEGLELWRLGKDHFDEFNDFIFRVYAEAFGENGNLPFTHSDIVEQSSIYFHQTKVCGIKHPSGVLLGTWGLVLKDLEKDSFPLPIETRYGLTPEQIVNNANAPSVRYIFNGWRTAIDKEAIQNLNIPKQKSIFIFDFLLRGLTKDFAGESSSYLGVSEMEMLVLKYHRRVGIPWVILGEPLHFWGRDRFPCAFQLGLFEDYLKTNHPDRYKFIYDK